MKLLILLTTLTSISCTDITSYMQNLNDVTTKFNAMAASISWESAITPGNTERTVNYQRQRIDWEGRECAKLAALEGSQLLNSTERRMAYLMCRGARFTVDEARQLSILYENLQTIYSEAKVCIPYDKTVPSEDLAGIEAAILDYISIVTRVLDLGPAGVGRAAQLAVKENYVNVSVCLRGEADFEKMTKFSRNEKVLRWLWLVWRGKVGPPMKEPYGRLVTVENRAARRNGYSDIGAVWREELETPDLRRFCRHLINQVRPIYSLLHGVARFYLRREYGEAVPERGAIPAHLLGNLWGQNWESIVDLILPRTIDLDKSIKNRNWTTVNLVKHSEDFYQSLGLPAMTDKFWRESVFDRRSHNTRCHGTAADMFKDGDFRLLYCSGSSPEDLYVLHHEMGHIQYYMAYENQPGIFRQANSALHETIGDTIMYGVLTPQHLNRLGLINDTMLYINPTTKSEDILIFKDPNILYEATEELNQVTKASDTNQKVKEHINAESEFNSITNDDADEHNGDKLKIEDPPEEPDPEWSTDDILLLKQALNKIPQIPFALAIDEYRWRYFEGYLKEGNFNKEFWDLVLELQGIAPPEKRGEEYFDVGAKYHVPDNTPFIRYFLSSFLQHQLFETLCKASVFGRVGAKEDIPTTIPMYRCDIYGSKASGKILKNFMSKGHSQHWRDILRDAIGTDAISPSALARYYRPLYKLLVKLVRAHRIPIGW